jgi:hypothetical protein
MAGGVEHRNAWSGHQFFAFELVSQLVGIKLMIRRSVVRVHPAPVWEAFAQLTPAHETGSRAIVGQAAMESRRLLAPGSGW